MNSNLVSNQITDSGALPRVNIGHHTQWQTKAAGLLAIVLMLAPRTRIVIGAPLYLIDVLAFLILITPLRSPKFSWAPRPGFTQIISVFLVLILVSEIRGMIAYDTVLESIYMMARYVIAVSVFFTLPRLLASSRDINLILKGVVFGTFVSSILVILYSLGPTRSLVVGAIYSNSVINPGWEELIRVVQIFGAGEAAMRGRSLAGAATLTAGFIATTWPLAFLAYRRFEDSLIWKRVALATTVIAPVGILMTYGRGAWLMVTSVILLVAVFGMASGRKILLIAMAAAAIILTQFSINSELFYMEKIIKGTQSTIDNPFTDISTRERVFSYIEPFEHLAENPIWFIVGAGRTGNRVTNRGGLEVQLYDEGGRATHSAFSMAYYSFGMIAAMCQVLLIFRGFIFILRRMRLSQHSDPHQKLVWQTLFICWCPMTLWWASAHSIVGEPRGAMLLFFMLGLLVVFEKLRLFEVESAKMSMTSGIKR